MDNSCLKGAKEICEAVGENPKCIHELVRDHGLPAWKRGSKGTWRALQEDLHRWMREQRDRNLGLYLYNHQRKEDPMGGSRPGAPMNGIDSGYVPGYEGLDRF